MLPPLAMDAAPTVRKPASVTLPVALTFSDATPIPSVAPDAARPAIADPIVTAPGVAMLTAPARPVTSAPTSIAPAERSVMLEPPVGFALAAIACTPAALIDAA